METRDIGISVLGPQIEDRGRVVEVEKGVMTLNNRYAGQNRERLAQAGVRAVNVLSSPGAGKTALLARTLQDLSQLGLGVVVGDLATDNDAERLRVGGATVVQIQTQGVCHLEAAMVAKAMDALDWNHLKLLFIENVGNLVCPASYDLGESERVVLFSVTEGEDKPLKYPKIFKSAQLVVISKSDIAEAVGFNRQLAWHNLRQVAPQAQIIELSSRTGEGLEAWYTYLRQG